MLRNSRLLKISLIFIFVFSLLSCQRITTQEPNEIKQDKLIETGYYTNKEDVSLFLKTYNKLPDNYITKDEAQQLGWDNDKGNLWDVSDKKSIGGDRFYNREGLLPKKDNVIYYECDIDYEGGYRNAKRIVYSNDGYIYYTSNHYESFELLYEGN